MWFRILLRDLGVLVCLLGLAGTRVGAATENDLVFDVPRLDGITIDGKGDDWGDGGFRGETLASSTYPIPSARDFDAAFRLGWETRGLLLLAMGAGAVRAAERAPAASLGKPPTIFARVGDKVLTTLEFERELDKRMARFADAREKLMAAGQWRDENEQNYNKLREGMRQFEEYKIMVLPDHRTPIVRKTHTSEPVPFAFCSSASLIEISRQHIGFNETSAEKSGLFVENGFDLMDFFIKS